MTTTFTSVILWLAGGLLSGSLYWLTLHWNVALLAAGRSVALAIFMQLLRLAVLGGALALVARDWGWLALLSSTGGLLLARAAVVHRFGRG